MAVPLLAALLGGGLVAAVADVMRARRERLHAPAQLEQIVSTGARDAVASLREALEEANGRSERLDRRLAETQAELREVRRRLQDASASLREVRAHNTEMEHALTAARDRIRLCEATIAVLQGDLPPGGDQEP